VFLRFAEDLASAEEKRELVRVLANVDRYVEEAIEASDRGAYGLRRRLVPDPQPEMMDLES
jgi:hypothetical protein